MLFGELFPTGSNCRCKLKLFFMNGLFLSPKKIHSEAEWNLPVQRDFMRLSTQVFFFFSLLFFALWKGHNNVLLAATFRVCDLSGIWKLQRPDFSSGAKTIRKKKKKSSSLSWIFSLRHLRKCSVVQERLESHPGNTDMQPTAQQSHSHPGQPSGWSAPLSFITKEGPQKSVQGLRFVAAKDRLMVLKNEGSWWWRSATQPWRRTGFLSKGLWCQKLKFDVALAAFVR